MFRVYIKETMGIAKYKILEGDKSFYGEIPGFPELHANAETLEECRKQLETSVEEWVRFRVSKKLPIPPPPGTRRSIKKGIHYEMVSDQKRVTPFKQAIELVCKGKRVLESGAGFGILTLLAARAGAEHVFAVEVDPDVASFLEDNVQASPYKDKITILVKDTCEVTLADLGGQKADVVIVENLSTWLVTEPQVAIMNHINKNLIQEGGIRLPQAVDNVVELSYAQYDFEGVLHFKSHFFEFAGIRKAAVLSDPKLFTHVEMDREQNLEICKSLQIKVKQSGILNSLRLTSPIQVYQDITFQSSDSLTPPVVVPLEKELSVSKGDTVEISIDYRYRTSWAIFHCTARAV